jgi:uncharacterized membrane protein YkgB
MVLDFLLKSPLISRLHQDDTDYAQYMMWAYAPPPPDANEHSEDRIMHITTSAGEPLTIRFG